MTLLHPCAPCEMGNHDAHHEVIEAAPPGMMGGIQCPCKGECIDGRYCPSEFNNILALIRDKY